MKIRKVLIVYKKSTYQIQAIEHQESRFLQLLDSGSDTVTRVKVAHEEHYATIESLQRELCARKIDFSSISRVDLNNSVEDVDLVISVGGDGTFLNASHYLRNIPMLGINSSRSSSFGHFCLANESNIAQVLDEIESNTRVPERLLRLELSLNGSTLPELVLNEVLFCHNNPAGTSRYFIEIGELREEQRSSGMWIGPPAGSTGALRGAGGTILPITARQYQYVVREPWPRPSEKWQLLQGLLDANESIKIVSQTRTGSLFIDGPHIDYRFALGDQLIIKGSNKDLLAFVQTDISDLFLEKTFGTNG